MDGISHDNLKICETTWSGKYTNIQHPEVVMLCFETIDGKTYIDLNVNTSTGLSPTLNITKSTTDLMTVDMGDGTIYTSSASGAIAISHTYSASSDNTVSIDCAGEYVFDNLLGGDGDIWDALVSVILGDSFKNDLPPSFLFYANSLKYLICINATSLGSSFISRGYSMVVINIPNVVSLGGSVSSGSTSLAWLNMPNATSIINSFSGVTFSMTHLSIGDASAIGINFFQSCRELRTVVFITDTPPTVASNGIFSNCSLQLKIYVPLASLTAYKTNTNMTHLADQMVGY